jgi:hypothetical protein
MDIVVQEVGIIYTIQAKYIIYTVALTKEITHQVAGISYITTAIYYSRSPVLIMQDRPAQVVKITSITMGMFTNLSQAAITKVMAPAAGTITS